MIGQIVDWLIEPAHWQGSTGVPARVLEHLGYTFLAVVIALAIGLPLGLLIGHTRRGTVVVAGLTNALRALPTLGLLILLVILLLPRITTDLVYLIPAETVLVLLALPPILTNTYAGVQGVPPAVRDAAEGMGMTPTEVLLRVEFPVALPLILSGVRAATLQALATATVTAYVSLGGLGRFIIDGLAQRDFPQMAGGALLVAGLALAAEGALALFALAVVSPGISGRHGRSERSGRQRSFDPLRGRPRPAHPLKEELS